MVSLIAAMEKAGDVEGVFQQYIRTFCPTLDQYGSSGKDAFLGKISPFIRREDPIHFVFPGFPAKSPNTRTKVLGELPDGTEEVSFIQFAEFANQVREIYGPGVKINVISDGYVFNDLVGISPAIVDAYEQEAKSMADPESIVWHTLRDFYPKGTSRNEQIRQLMDRHGESIEDLMKRVKQDDDVRMLYNGMNIFMQNDIPWPESWSRGKKKKEAKLVAKEMIQRSEAYTGLIKVGFSDAVRLSCHVSTNNGSKYSWDFIPGSKSWAAPWHNALLVQPDGSYNLIKKSQIIAEGSGLEIVEEKGRPYFARHVGTDVGIRRNSKK